MRNLMICAVIGVMLFAFACGQIQQKKITQKCEKCICEDAGPAPEYWAELSNYSPTKIQGENYNNGSYTQLIEFTLEILNPELFTEGPIQEAQRNPMYYDGRPIRLDQLHLEISYWGGISLGDCWLGHMGGGGFNPTHSEIEMVTRYQNEYDAGMIDAYVTYDYATVAHGYQTGEFGTCYDEKKAMCLSCQLYFDEINQGAIRVTVKDFSGSGKKYGTKLVQSGLEIKGHKLLGPVP